MEINTANGFYQPNYFFMKIETDENINKCIENNEQTFIHEYIHFLQDLILPYCIRNTLVNNRKFALLSSTAYNEEQIERPFNKWDEDTKITNNQFAYTWGGHVPQWNNFINEQEKIIKIEREYFELYNEAKVYGFILETNKFKYHAGARDLLEYIAHKIEEKYWEVNHPAYPYETVDLLFEYYGLVDLKEEVKLCLVEFSLYNDNPFNQLIFLIENMILKEPDKFRCYSDVKNILLKVQWNAKGGQKETLFSKTERRLKDLSWSLSNKYQNSNFQSIQEWINLVIEFSREKLFGEFIFTELFLMDAEMFYEAISSFIEEIGIPLIFNAKDECISLLPKRFDQNTFVNLYTAYKFMNFATTNETDCPLWTFCQSSPDDITNENCKTNPIIRANQSVLCPFGSFVKSYGFHDIKWKIK